MLDMPQRAQASQLTFHATLIDANGKTENSWNLWVYPKELLAESSHKIRASGFDALRKIYSWALEPTARPTLTDTDLLITTVVSPDIIDYLKAGGRVILVEPEPAFTVEKTNFRLSSWDGGGPSGTILDSKHAALRAVPSDGWCDLQFYPLIQGSKTVLLDALPVKVRPLVRCIDRPTRLANRAYLFEATVGRGKLLVSGFNFARAIDSKDPAGIFVFDQLVRYTLGPDFSPEASLPEEALKRKATK